MANVNKTQLEADIQANINAITTSTCAEDIFAAAVSISEASDQCISSFVANCASLPDLLFDIPAGQMVFVDSNKIFAISNGNGCWLTPEGNIFRNDNACAFGRLWTWGYRNSGSLADSCNLTGTVFSPTTPINVNATYWCRVSTSSRNFFGTLAPSGGLIDSLGRLWTWGNNCCGKLGTGNTTNRSSPGHLAGGGGSSNWCNVSVNPISTAGIKTDGTLWTWGGNFCGMLGTGDLVHRSSPGTTAGGGTNWSRVFEGDCLLGGIKTDGTLWIWGNNPCGTLGDGTTTARSSPVTVAGGGTTWCQAKGGYLTTAAVKTDGTLWTWGRNSYGTVGDGTTTDRSSPVTTAGGGTNWCHTAVGYRMAGGVKTDGTLWTWGMNASLAPGQLGSGNTINRSSPGTVAGGGSTWKCLTSGVGNTMALKTTGELWVWGTNCNGGLGNNNNGARSSPVTTCAGGSTWISICSGNGVNSAIRK